MKQRRTGEGSIHRDHRRPYDDNSNILGPLDRDEKHRPPLSSATRFVRRSFLNKSPTPIASSSLRSTSRSITRLHFIPIHESCCFSSSLRFSSSITWLWCSSSFYSTILGLVVGFLVLCFGELIFDHLVGTKTNGRGSEDANIETSSNSSSPSKKKRIDSKTSGYDGVRRMAVGLAFRAGRRVSVSSSRQPGGEYLCLPPTGCLGVLSYRAVTYQCLRR